MTGSRYLVPAFILVIIVSAVVSFHPCLNNGFVNWDDPELLTENTAVQHPSLGSISRFFTRYYCGTYVPLTLLSFAAEYGLFKVNPVPYHALNVLLHLLNALLVLWLVSLLFKDPWVAFITALIFAVHPLRVESVAWIAERKDVLFAFFYLLAIITYIYYAGRARLLLYFASLACFVLALFAKGVAATLPFVLLLFDFFQDRRGRSIIMNKLPYLVLAIPFAVMAFAAQRTLPGHAFPFFKNIFVMSYVLAFYCAKIVLPIGLSPLYPFPPAIAGKLPLSFWLAPVIVVIIIVLAAWAAKRWKTIALGCLFFLLTILPVLQFIPVAGPEIAANRYTYIPSIGIILIFAAAMVRSYKKLGTFGSGSLKFLPVVITAAIVVLFSLASSSRCRVWQNSLALWSDIIEKYPSFPHAYTMRAQAYADAANSKMAIADYTHALVINPGFNAALLGRADVFARMNAVAQALADYERAAANDPQDAKIYYDRGNLRMKTGDYSGAVADYTTAIQIDKHLADAYVNRGNALTVLGKLDSARGDYERALEIDPFNDNAIYNRAVLFFLKGDNARAWQDVKKLLERGYPVKPEFLEVLKKTVPDQQP